MQPPPAFIASLRHWTLVIVLSAAKTRNHLQSPMPNALAIAAHPDDIEFMMAGTLLLLKERGWEIHYFNLSTGNRGSARHNAPAASLTATAVLPP